MTSGEFSTTCRHEQGRVEIKNTDGVPGELVYILGVDQAELLATFVFPRAGGTPIGVSIEVRGEPSNLKKQVTEIASMIDTTTYRPAGEVKS